ncbi:TetR family transcriptional regulator [Streptomyces sp. NPDC020096]
MQVRAARTRQALINAAAKLIDDRGMKGTGLLDVSRAAGVSKGALYFHFTSKDELITAVADEARCSVRALAAEHLDSQSSTLAGAARFTDAMSRRMREDHVLRAGLRLESEGAVSKVTGGESLRETWLSTLRGRLAKDAAEGALRQGTDARDTANLLAAVTVGLESLGREDESWWDPEVTSGIWQLLMLFAGPQQQLEQVTRLTGEQEAAHPREAEPTPEREVLGEVREFTPSVPSPSSPADLMEVAGAARAS